MGSVKVNFWYAFAATSILVLGAAYTLWMVKRVIFGAVVSQHVEQLTDITLREKLILAILALAVLGMGMYPQPFTEIMHTSVNDLLVHIARSKL